MSGSQELEELQKALTRSIEFRRFNKMLFFEPYPKQEQFFDLGALKYERLLMAGNQLGKTEAGAYEATCHLTGLYPDWWLGRRWDRPTVGWICGETGQVVRDVQQEKLCGEAGVVDDFGTGYIPRDLFVDKPSLARGVADAFDTIQVRHKSGGVSIGVFKSYEQGRTKFQGKGIDWGWLDEEPDMEIYSEALTRTTATGGMLFTTFTPLKGPTKLVERFTETILSTRGLTTMTIEDARHISPEEREKRIAGYEDYERQARAYGIPMMGEGRVFAVPESMITEAAIETIPHTWKKIWGIDFGIAIDHPFAAALLLYDPDHDVIHVHHVIKIVSGLPINHAYAMRRAAAQVPVAWPHDGLNREAGTGESLRGLYVAQGLKMLPEEATFNGGGYSLEAGVTDMKERFLTGRLKIAGHLSDVFDEYRFYHRKDGKIVRKKDDVLSAIRYGMMMLRHARAVPLGNGQVRSRGEQTMARGIDFDLD